MKEVYILYFEVSMSCLFTSERGEGSSCPDSKESKKPSWAVVAHAINPSTREAEASGSL